MKKLELILAATLASTSANAQSIDAYMQNVRAIRSVAVYDVSDPYQVIFNLAPVAKLKIPMWHGSATAYHQSEKLTRVFSNYHIIDPSKADTFRKQIEKNRDIQGFRFLRYEFYLVDDMNDRNTSDDILLTKVGEDKPNDMVYFRTKKPVDMTDMELGESAILRPGDPTYLIGVHLSVAKLITQGIIAGDSVFDEGHFMIDNKANGGVSGGPVMSVQDGELKLVGVFHQYTTNGERFACIIPVDHIREGLEKSIR